MSDEPPTHQIVLDLETSVENALVMTGCISFLVALGILLEALDHPGFVTQGTGRWWLLGLALLVVLSWGARALVDEHYILDLKERKLFFHRKWGGWKSVIPVASFEHFVAFAVQGTFQSSRSGSWWEYTPVLVTRDKRVLCLADSGREAEGFEQASERARELAELTGTDCHPPQAERILKVTAPGPTLTYVVKGSPWPMILFIISLSVAIGLGIAFYAS